MKFNTWTSSGGTVYAHNGPVCSICNTPYLNQHTCTKEQLQRVIDQLERLKEKAPGFDFPDPTRNCPCRSENGGSGICGCILSGPRVTC